MRYKDLVDITIPAEDAVTISAALTTLEEKFSGLKALSKDDILHMAAIGLRNETFVMGAIEAGKNNPELLPRNIDMAAIERDRVAREQLQEYALRVQRLNEKLQHTRLALGADLYGAARAIYKALQEFGRGAGINELLAELGRRFKKRKTSDLPAPTVP